MSLPALPLPGFGLWFELLWRRLRWRVRRILTGRRFQTVVLVGRAGKYSGELGRMVHLWGVNFAYKFHSGLSRLYTLDARERYVATGEFDGFVKDIKALGLEFVAQEPWPEIPNSRAFSLDKVRRELGIGDYYTSTVAYMLADAIREGYGVIVIHQLLSSVSSTEYYEQKACLDFWSGLAMGLGIEVLTSEDCLIGQPYPWQSELYGYITQDNWRIAAEMIGNVVRAISRMPRVYRRGKV